MSRLKEITSTEKLLALIRSKKSNIPPVSRDTSIAKLPKRKFKPTFLRISKPESMNVGVDIGHEFLRMVKAKKTDDGTMAVIDCKNVPFTHIASKKSPEFRSFLRSELLHFCGTEKNVDIWAIMSAARVNVRHVRIPKVAKKQIENAIYWTIKKETPFDEKDTVFDFEIQGEVIEQGVNRFVAIVYTAPKNEVEELKNLFSEVGMPLTGLSITPFAIQNMFAGGTVPAAGGTVASLFIGNDFSRIDIYAQGKLTMTRGIKAGINSLIESLIEKMRGASQVTCPRRLVHFLS